MARKPSTRMHEVVDTSYRFSMVVHCGSQSACHAYWEAQPARRRQNLIVRPVKGREGR